jgi:hypothetical protein
MGFHNPALCPLTPDLWFQLSAFPISAFQYGPPPLPQAPEMPAGEICYMLPQPQHPAAPGSSLPGLSGCKGMPFLASLTQFPGRIRKPLAAPYRSRAKAGARPPDISPDRRYRAVTWGREDEGEGGTWVPLCGLCGMRQNKLPNVADLHCISVTGWSPPRRPLVSTHREMPDCGAFLPLLLTQEGGEGRGEEARFVEILPFPLSPDLSPTRSSRSGTRPTRPVVFPGSTPPVPRWYRSTRPGVAD